ncbi:MAG: His/Gly/Thr/Pro-type tRNA ligase C-terminal domain-containing protein, partial [Acidimicrobiales bacterium]
KEAEHVEGFSPELAVVTHAGGKELDEPAVVRPTSETIIDVFLAKWVQSHRDLPMLINQWANVVRWELRPRLFLRTTEFLWQEGHTAHATQDDARQYALRILNEVYEDFAVNVLGIPVVVGRKTELERFAGADATYTIEAMMGDGKALQMGTSHELGQNFAKVFGIQFQDEAGQNEFAWQTSWGVTTRLVGAVIMAHGDDNGLRLPPHLAPVQAVVLLVRGEDGAGEKAAAIAAELKATGIRVELDDRLGTSFGRRAVDWELKGVPVRVEVGPRDLATGLVTLVRRDTNTKEQVGLDGLAARIASTLDDVQATLYRQALERREARTTDTASIDEVADATQQGFARVPWDVARDAEAKLNEAGQSVRCLQRADGGLPGSSSEPDLVATVAKAY